MRPARQTNCSRCNVLERFLYRLSVSAYSDLLVLKGGMLLSAFGQRRPTRDIDLLAKATSNEPAAVATLVRDIAAFEADDGVVYDIGELTTRMIREQDLWPARACCRLSMSRLALAGTRSRCALSSSAS